MEFPTALMCGFLGAATVAAFLLDVVIHTGDQKPTRRQSHSAHLLAGGMLTITVGLYLWALYAYPYAYKYELMSLDEGVVTTYTGWLYMLVTSYMSALVGLSFMVAIRRQMQPSISKS